MVAPEKKNFLIALIITIALFIGSYLLGTYVGSITSRVYGQIVFFSILIIGLIIFVLVMYKIKK